MNNIIAIANHKGGVAKTTTSSNVGAILARMGKKVLLIDLDPQENLTTSYLKEEPESTIFETLTEGTPLPITTIRENLDIVPSSVKMANLEILLSSKKGRNHLLKNSLDSVKNKYDYILLDCPPSLGIITINALVSANKVFIPIIAETIPIRGLKSLTDIIEGVRSSINPDLSLSGIIITRWEGHNINKEIESVLRHKFGDKVFNTKIRKNVCIAESPLEYTDILSYSPRSNGAKDYTELTKEIIKQK